MSIVFISPVRTGPTVSDGYELWWEPLQDLNPKNVTEKWKKEGLEKPCRYVLELLGFLKSRKN